jgi:chromate transporter
VFFCDRGNGERSPLARWPACGSVATGSQSGQAMMRDVNAAVVGLLGAALYNPVWTSSVQAPGDFAVALTGFVLLTAWRTPPLVVVIVSAIGGVLLALIND